MAMLPKALSDISGDVTRATFPLFSFPNFEVNQVLIHHHVYLSYGLLLEKTRHGNGETHDFAGSGTIGLESSII